MSDVFKIGSEMHVLDSGERYIIEVLQTEDGFVPQVKNGGHVLLAGLGRSTEQIARIAGVDLAGHLAQLLALTTSGEMVWGVRKQVKSMKPLCDECSRTGIKVEMPVGPLAANQVTRADGTKRPYLDMGRTGLPVRIALCECIIRRLNDE